METLLDNTKFGYTVVKIMPAYPFKYLQSGMYSPLGINFNKEVANMQNKDHKPLDKDLWFTYSVYPTKDVELILKKADFNEIHSSNSVKANVWNEVSFKISAGDTIALLTLCLPLNDFYGEFYVKNIMVNYGDHPMPYDDNNIIPESLVEQIVPNEFILDKQVYQKTVDIITDASFKKGVILWPNVFGVEWCSVVGGLIGNSLSDYWSYDIKEYCVFLIDNGRALHIVSKNDDTANKRIRCTVKYTKK